MEQIRVTFQKHEGSDERTLNILLDEKLGEFRKEVQTLLGLPDDPPCRLVLDRTGEELRDNATVREAGIQANDKLLLFPLGAWQEKNSRGSVSSNIKAVQERDGISRDTETIQPEPTKTTFSSLKDWQKATITGSVIGTFMLVALVLTRPQTPPSPPPTLQQTTAQQQITAQRPSQSQPISQEEAVNLIQRWLQAKRVMLAPPYNRQIAAEITTGEQYDKTAGPDGSIDWLEKNNAYYRFGVQKIDGVERLVTNGNEATIQVRVTEDRTLYKDGKIDPNETDFKTRTVVYNLQLLNGTWKIVSYKIIKK
ncbi:IMS domain-containing protein [Argonema antarcticum]|uniref:IMS domain-containing protein n=1 Tax=Argonema antarcticum TaxID=2942763 RepID=UPI0020114CA4|nr:IMS domain-containing protein [Argonema antarcticum]MCL1469125.1 IMS domain-containing protein [Argonema antarcticum A004/B2]